MWRLFGENDGVILRVFSQGFSELLPIVDAKAMPEKEYRLAATSGVPGIQKIERNLPLWNDGGRGAGQFQYDSLKPYVRQRSAGTRAFRQCNLGTKGNSSLFSSRIFRIVENSPSTICQPTLLIRWNFRDQKYFTAAMAKLLLELVC